MASGVTTGAMLPDPPDPGVLLSLGLRHGETRVVDVNEVWWRVHRTKGDHVLPWNRFRAWGPRLRFDPHRLPEGQHPEQAIWYGAFSPVSAFAEAFQNDRRVDRARDEPYLTGVWFTRLLTVLDVAVDSPAQWSTRVGGNYAMSTGPHELTQAWARAIVAAFPKLDGIRYNSRFAGEPCLSLFSPAQSAMPDQPVMSQPLTHPELDVRTAGAAKRLGYLLL